MGDQLGGGAIRHLGEGESLLWEGRPLFLPFLLGSLRATGLGGGAVLFFLAGAMLTILDRAMRVTAPLFLLVVAVAFSLGYLLGAYLDWKALRFALTDKRFLAFGTSFPLGDWRLSFPLKHIFGMEVWEGWVDRWKGSATLVIHGKTGGSVHTGVWAGVPEAFMLEERMRSHILAHARRASVNKPGHIDPEATTNLALHHLLSSKEGLIWAAKAGRKAKEATDALSRWCSIPLGAITGAFLSFLSDKWGKELLWLWVALSALIGGGFALLLHFLLSLLMEVYALTEYRLLAMTVTRGRRALSWLRLDCLNPAVPKPEGTQFVKVHPARGVISSSSFDLHRPGGGVLVRGLDSPKAMQAFLGLLLEAISSAKGPSPREEEASPPDSRGHRRLGGEGERD